MMHNGVGTGYSSYSDWLCGPGAFFPGPIGWAITLLFWVLVIFLAVKIFRALFFKGKGSSTTRLDTLKERYAKGEINEKEYLNMKTELS